MKTLYYIISSTGEVTGLWNDFLSAVPSKKTVHRASDIEYDQVLQGWIIKFRTPFEYLNHKIGALLFNTRLEALQCEEKLINESLAMEVLDEAGKDQHSECQSDDCR